MQYMHIMHTCMLTYMHMSIQNNTNLIHAYQVATTSVVRVMIFWCKNTRRTGGAQTCCASSPRKKTNATYDNSSNATSIIKTNGLETLNIA